MTSGCLRCSSGWLPPGSPARRPGSGFYRRVRQPGGENEIQAIDPVTLQYRPPAPARLPSIEAAKSIDVHWRPHQDAFPRPGSRWRVSPRHSRADAGVLREGDAGDLARHRRCRSRSAVGVWLGARAVRDAGRHRRSRGRGRMAFQRWQRCAAAADAGRANCVGRRSLRSGPIAPAGPGLQILRTAKDRSAVVRRNLAPASSISVTAFSRSSSTRR